MLIFYKNYRWINPNTGKKPVTGDEFKYMFFSHKNNPERIFLCMNPAIHPIKKHPVGFIGWPLLIIVVFLIDIFDSSNIFFMILFLVLIGILVSGRMFTFLSYLSYYHNEKKWKQRVLSDWKSGMLRYKYSESELGKFGPWGVPQDESLFF